MFDLELMLVCHDVGRQKLQHQLNITFNSDRQVYPGSDSEIRRKAK